MTKNIPLLKQVLAHIEANPETWRQDSWRCETGFCFAGWTAELTGAKWARPEKQLDPNVLRGDGESEHVADYAQRVLGLEENEADLLFSMFRTLDDLRRMVAEFEEDA